MVSPELQQVIETIRSRPQPATPPSIEEQRTMMDTMVPPLPDDIATERVDASGVPAEWISAPSADASRAVLYLHGGGYVLGSITSHRELASRISRASGSRVLVIDYRLAPENPFPAAVEDATAAYRWMLQQGVAPKNAAIAGDSAGGGLTIATLVALRDAGDPLPATAVCISPWVDLTLSGESMATRAADDPMVQRAGVENMAAAYLAGADPKTPLASPFYADLKGLPPLLIQVGTAETLYDDATRLAEKARAAGVEVALEPWEGMIHVFQMFAMAPEALQATDRIGAFIKEAVAAPAGS
jgi:epsilon-lactone hydrolase